MSNFKLSKKSLDKLSQTHPDLRWFLDELIQVTPYDFGILSGTRTMTEQRALVERGASQTLNSKHLPAADGYSRAADILCYRNGIASWKGDDYLDIIDAVHEMDCDVEIRYGAFWDTLDRGATARQQQADYEERCEIDGREPFRDFAHLELA